MKTVEFKFDIDDVVVDSFGKKGIINMLGVDSRWWKEKQLSTPTP